MAFLLAIIFFFQKGVQSMEISIFLARVFGLYLLIVGLAMLFNRKVILIAVNNMLQQPGLLFFSAIVTLILGILLLEWHNIWIANRNTSQNK